MNVDVMLGKTLIAVEGMTKDSDEVIFRCSDGTAYRMDHQQDCCESVDIEDVEGDPTDLIGLPLVLCEEVNDGMVETMKLLHVVKPEKECSESGTWTYYRFGTAKGVVVLRWLGESNGYYSESVDFEEIKA